MHDAGFTKKIGTFLAYPKFRAHSRLKSWIA